MTCRDAMTSDPASCLPSDTAARAARLMAERNVGPIPIVADLHERKLVGIVTDRDLALKILADRRDPHTTRLEEIMSKNPVTVRAEEPYGKAVRLMQRNQVRRVPVVDADGLLIGIISQRDVALRSDDETAGRLVEDVSESRWIPAARRWMPQVGDKRNVNLALLFASGLAVGLGAGLLIYAYNRRRGPEYSTSALAYGYSEPSELPPIDETEARYSPPGEYVR